MYYFALFLFLMMWKRRRLRILSGILLGISVVLFGIRIRTGLTVTCLDVGQGDGIVLELPGGETFLVDGGSSESVGALCAAALSEELWGNPAGLREFLSPIPMKTISVEFWNCCRQSGMIRLLWRSMLCICRTGNWNKQRSWDGRLAPRVLARFPVEHRSGPGKVCGAASTGVEHAGGSERRFPGTGTGLAGSSVDCSQVILDGRRAGTANSVEPCDFLKVAHHGSGNSVQKEFLQAVRPAYGFISCGENNWYGHPAAETLDRLEKAGCRYWTTMEYGALSLWTDGEKVQVRGYLGNSGG